MPEVFHLCEGQKMIISLLKYELTWMEGWSRWNVSGKMPGRFNSRSQSVQRSFHNFAYFFFLFFWSKGFFSQQNSILCVCFFFCFCAKKFFRIKKIMTISIRRWSCLDFGVKVWLDSGQMIRIRIKVFLLCVFCCLLMFGFGDVVGQLFELWTGFARFEWSARHVYFRVFIWFLVYRWIDMELFIDAVKVFFWGFFFSFCFTQSSIERRTNERMNVKCDKWRNQIKKKRKKNEMEMKKIKRTKLIRRARKIVVTI